ncbi:MAG: hypothetical protein NZ740_09935 [Kiritimatiellae bacterium]|nr:hypothetical protein [Kiritimatiellia bacterium]MDW8459412.1 hypothetical protein [Verrucomicrobiota bacterium]
MCSASWWREATVRRAVAQVVAAIWKPADYPCGKRLAAIMPLWLPAHEARIVPLDEALRARTLCVSPATLDRLLGNTAR